MSILQRITPFFNNNSPEVRKDKILSFLISPDRPQMTLTTENVAPLVGLPWFACNYYCHQLEEEGLIEVLRVASRNSGVTHELLIKWPTEKAKMFMLDGGHRAIARKASLKRLGGRLLISITTINAFVATYVAYLSYIIANDTKTLNRQLIERDKRIDSLVNKVSESVAIKPKSTTIIKSKVPLIKKRK